MQTKYNQVFRIPKGRKTIVDATNYAIGLNLESVRDPSNTSALDYWIDAEMADQLGHQTFSCQS